MIHLYLIYVIIAGVLAGFFPVKQFSLISLRYHCGTFSAQTPHSHSNPNARPTAFFSKVENTRSPVPREVDDGVVGGRQAGWPSPDVDEALAMGQAADERPLSRLLQRQQASWGGDGQGLRARLLLGL